MKGLKYISFGNTTGYAVAAKSYIRALVDAGVALTWTPMMPGKNLSGPAPTPTWSCPKLAGAYHRVLDYDTVLIHTVPEYYPRWIEQERREGRKILGYTVWELERLPDHWPSILNQLDGVLVPCRWNQEVFRRSGVTVPIQVVPHLSQFTGLPEPTSGDRLALRTRLGEESAWRDRFIYYTVGFWSNRKAPALAVAAYLQAFEARDPVLMIVKTCAQDITRWHRSWRNGFRRRHPSAVQTLAELKSRFPRPAPLIAITDESLSDAEMLALHELGDCFVSLARAEGWGLGAFEAARLGKPVVVTGYGGQLDFLDPALTRLVDYRMVPVHEPTWALHYRPSDQWAEPSVTQAAQQLRAVFEGQPAAIAQAQHSAAQIAERFSPAMVVDSLLKALA